MRKNTRARALSLIRNHKIPLERWTENSRESLSLSLSSSLSRAPFGEREKIARKKSDTKKVRGSGKESTREYNFILLFRKEKERYIFCSDDDDEDVPVGENVFVHILRSTLRQIDVRALLLHFLSPHRGLKYEEEETANKVRFGSKFVVVCGSFFFTQKQRKISSFCCVFGCLASEGLGGKGSLFITLSCEKAI